MIEQATIVLEMLRKCKLPSDQCKEIDDCIVAYKSAMSAMIAMNASNTSNTSDTTNTSNEPQDFDNIGVDDAVSSLIDALTTNKYSYAYHVSSATQNDASAQLVLSMCDMLAEDLRAGHITPDFPMQFTTHKKRTSSSEDGEDGSFNDGLSNLRGGNSMSECKTQ